MGKGRLSLRPGWKAGEAISVVGQSLLFSGTRILLPGKDGEPTTPLET